RLDDFAHQLRAACLEKKQFRFGSHPRALRRKLQKFADRLANGSATGFARDQKRDAGFFEMVRQAPDQGRFPTAFRPFKGNKWQSDHDLTSSLRSRFSSSKSQTPKHQAKPK